MTQFDCLESSGQTHQECAHQFTVMRIWMNGLTHVRRNCIHYKCKPKRWVRVEMLSATCVLLCVSHELAAVHVHLPRTHSAIIIYLAMNFNGNGRSGSSDGTEKCKYLTEQRLPHARVESCDLLILIEYMWKIERSTIHMPHRFHKRITHFRRYLHEDER